MVFGRAMSEITPFCARDLITSSQGRTLDYTVYHLVTKDIYIYIYKYSIGPKQMGPGPWLGPDPIGPWARTSQGPGQGWPGPGTEGDL